MAKKIYKVLPGKGLVGTARYPWLTKPSDRWDPNGVYSVDVVVDPNEPEVAEMVAELEKIRDAAFTEFYNEAKPAVKKKMQKAPVYIEVDDPNTGELTGEIAFRCKNRAYFKDKVSGEITPWKLPIFCADGFPFDPKEDGPIYSGTKLRVNVAVRPYLLSSTTTVGLALTLRAVQVVELVTAGGSAEGYGFETEGNAPRSGGSASSDDDGDDDYDEMVPF